MIIGGLQKFSLLDYPDHIAAIVFTQGCNFRCQFCYNPMLVWPTEVGKLKNTSIDFEENKKGHSLLAEDDLFYWLDSRRGKLDAIVVTGGEPTIHADLPKFIGRIKNHGFKVKLDTNGTNPVMLSELIKSKLIDYIAMDVKTSLEKYKTVVGAQINLADLISSVKIIMASALPYEFRTTVVPKLHEHEDIAQIGELIVGAEKWYLQFFKNDTALVNSDFEHIDVYGEKQMKELKHLGGRYVKRCYIR